MLILGSIRTLKFVVLHSYNIRQRCEDRVKKLQTWNNRPDWLFRYSRARKSVHRRFQPIWTASIDIFDGSKTVKGSVKGLHQKLSAYIRTRKTILLGKHVSNGWLGWRRLERFPFRPGDIHFFFLYYSKNLIGLLQVTMHFFLTA